MRQSENPQNAKTGAIFMFVVVLATLALFTLLFFDSISDYSEFDVDYSDLMYEELSFERYEKIQGYKRHYKYVIYFDEYEKPFEISSIADKKLDKAALDQLTENERLGVYYRETSSEKYQYEICEINHNSSTLLSLSDYRETNQNNQILGMIVCPIMIVVSLFMLWIFSRILKPTHDSTNLGKIKIEYTVNGKIIRIYNSAYVCSLVIDGEIADQYHGIVAGNFRLTGQLDVDGRQVPVEARMGQVNIRLYYDNKLVAKKFMGFG